MFSTLKLYALGAFLLVAAAHAATTAYLWHANSAKAEQIATLERTEGDLRRGQAAMQADYERQLASRPKMEATKKDIAHAKEAPVPDPIARALDGLRGLQAKPRSAR